MVAIAATAPHASAATTAGQPRPETLRPTSPTAAHTIRVGRSLTVTAEIRRSQVSCARESAIAGMTTTRGAPARQSTTPAATSPTDSASSPNWLPSARRCCVSSKRAMLRAWRTSSASWRAASPTTLLAVPEGGVSRRGRGCACRLGRTQERPAARPDLDEADAHPVRLSGFLGPRPTGDPRR
jgi:hypothetical protein